MEFGRGKETKTKQKAMTSSVFSARTPSKVRVVNLVHGQEFSVVDGVLLSIPLSILRIIYGSLVFSYMETPNQGFKASRSLSGWETGAPLMPSLIYNSRFAHSYAQYIV